MKKAKIPFLTMILVTKKVQATIRKSNPNSLLKKIKEANHLNDIRL